MRVALDDATDYLRALVHSLDRESFDLVLAEGRQGGRVRRDYTSVEDVARLLRARICPGADFTEIFDIARGRRIPSGADLDPMTLSDVGTLEFFI